MIDLLIFSFLHFFILLLIIRFSKTNSSPINKLIFMRNLTVLFLVLLVQFAFPAKLTDKQKALFDESLISKLKSSNLGRAVLLFA